MLLLGTFMTDINLGIFTAKLDPAQCIYATSEQLRIRHHHYHDVLLDDFPRRADGPRAADRAAADPAGAAAAEDAVSACSRRADHHHAADRPAERVSSTTRRW